MRFLLCVTALAVAGLTSDLAAAEKPFVGVKLKYCTYRSILGDRFEATSAATDLYDLREQAHANGKAGRLIHLADPRWERVRYRVIIAYSQGKPWAYQVRYDCYGPIQWARGAQEFRGSQGLAEARQLVKKLRARGYKVGNEKLYK